MKITFLGTGAYHPSESRHTACLFLPEFNIALDAGTSFFRVRDHIEPGRFDIFLTHFHIDHISGLHYLIDVLHEKDVPEVHIWGPVGVETAIVKFFEEPFFPVPVGKLPFRVKFHELDRKLSHRLRGATIRAGRFDHAGVDVLGYRVEAEGKSFVYITDTFADPANAKFAAGTDLLIHECNFRYGMEERAKMTGHSYSQRVGEYATAAGVKRLALTHMNPLDPEPDFCLRQVMEVFGETIMTKDKMEIHL